jgi:hypothetical protein
MDPRERYNDQLASMKQATASNQAQLWTAIPGYITKISDLAGQLTVDVQPTIQGIQTDQSGKSAYVKMPVLLDCPVIIMGGGGYSAVFPIAVNDEALVVFSSRNIDGWWQSGGVQAPGDQRQHDLSDGFAIVGPRNKTRPISAYPPTTMQLRSDDKSVFMELDQPNGTINITAKTLINMTAPTVKVIASSEIDLNTPTVKASQAITAGGNITAGLLSVAIALLNHLHSGVTSGGSNTGEPVPG